MRRSLLIASLLVLPACPSNATPDGGTDGGPEGTDAPLVDGGASDGGASDGGTSDGGASDAGPDAPGSSAMGDCRSDADCPEGTCVELTPGGYRVCRVTPVEATGCDAGRADACCDSGDCAIGACYLGPIRAFCGGPLREPANECGAAECSTDADCADGTLCAPAGTFGPVALCVTASCRVDADCNAEAGGHCVVVTEPCCGVRVGLLCTYDSDGCRSDADCTSGYCGIELGRSRCTAGGPICPR